MRCANLAHMLRARGVGVRFVSRPHAGHQIDMLRAREFEVDVIGGAVQEDATSTREALAGRTVDWLVVDHYGLDDHWERSLRSAARRIMSIDDLPARRHDCDLLLDQNAGERSIESFAARIPPRSSLALGPRYALLDPGYSHLRNAHPAHDGVVRRVLVSFGGSDPRDLTGLALSALSAPEFMALEVDIVTGTNYSFLPGLQEAAGRRPGTCVHGPQPSLAPLLAQADLAIGAGGTTTWERLCLGVPGVVLCMAENQRPGCEYLEKQGLIEYCGAAEAATRDSVAAALRRCLGDAERLLDMSSRGRSLVDGLGAARIAEHLHPTPASELRLRRARPDDLYLYFDWVNDPEVRRQSVQTARVEFPEHRRWFEARLTRPDSHLFVLLAGELPVGQIRFDIDDDGAARIDYSIDRFFRGRGWARSLLALGMRAMPAGTIFLGEVRPDNPASCAVFERAGYVEKPGNAEGLRVFLHGEQPCA